MLLVVLVLLVVLQAVLLVALLLEILVLLPLRLALLPLLLLLLLLLSLLEPLQSAALPSAPPQRPRCHAAHPFCLWGAVQWLRGELPWERQVLRAAQPVAGWNTRGGQQQQRQGHLRATDSAGAGGGPADHEASQAPAPPQTVRAPSTTPPAGLCCTPSLGDGGLLILPLPPPLPLLPLLPLLPPLLLPAPVLSAGPSVLLAGPSVLLEGRSTRARRSAPCSSTPWS